VIAKSPAAVMCDWATLSQCSALSSVMVGVRRSPSSPGFGPLMTDSQKNEPKFSSTMAV
jgi:hypothetical protein